jgi:hypothetical protein
VHSLAGRTHAQQEIGMAITFLKAPFAIAEQTRNQEVLIKLGE